MVHFLKALLLTMLAAYVGATTHSWSHTTEWVQPCKFQMGAFGKCSPGWVFMLDRWVPLLQMLAGGDCVNVCLIIHVSAMGTFISPYPVVSSDDLNYYKSRS